MVWKKILPNTFNGTRGKAHLENAIYGGRVLDSIGYTSTIVDVDLDGNIIQILDLPDLTFGIGFFNVYFFFESEGHLIMFGNKLHKVGWSSTPVWSFDFARGLPNMIGKPYGSHLR